jgi:hypothetical protein
MSYFILGSVTFLGPNFGEFTREALRFVWLRHYSERLHPRTCDLLNAARSSVRGVYSESVSFEVRTDLFAYLGVYLTMPVLTFLSGSYGVFQAHQQRNGII